MPDEHNGGEAERVDAVLDGNLPGVEPAHSDGATTGPTDTPPPQKPIRSGFRRRPRKDSPEQRAAGKSRTRRRSLGSLAARLLGKLWIPLVIIVVLAAGGVAVSRLHGVFGSEQSPSYGDANEGQAKPFNPKYLRYEVFGPAGTVADISFFDANGDPSNEDGVSLPWSLEFPITTAASIGSIAAQGYSGSIGCRILVDGAVKSEKITTHEVSSFTSCLLRAA
jgi:hypothetical protein